MVDKDYNHPSVIMYSTGNEVAETAQEKGIALTGDMTNYLHSLDSTRPVTCGINIFFNFLSSIELCIRDRPFIFYWNCSALWSFNCGKGIYGNWKAVDIYSGFCRSRVRNWQMGNSE